MKRILKTATTAFIGTTLLMGLTTYSSADQKTIMADEPNLAKMSGTFTIDPSHAHAGFSISHLGFSMQNGQFDTISGSVTLDPATPENSQVNVTIDANSLDSGWDKRDAHLKNPDFFNVKKFPKITFVSTKVMPTGKTTAKVTGNLTLLGVSKPVTLDIKMNKAADHPFKKGTYLVGFSGTTTIKRSEWGMTKYVPNIGDDVKIRLEIETIKTLSQNS